MRRVSLCAALATTALVLATTVLAQQHPVLHEYVPHLDGDEGALVVAEGDSTPAAIVSNGEVITPPRGGPLRGDERPMSPDPNRGDPHEPGRRTETFRPDRITELESMLSYFEVFSPSIAPYKRVSALNAVRLDGDGRTPVLYVAELPRVEVPPVGAGAEPTDGRARDRFWGSVVLEMQGGREIALPSVAPSARLLTIQTEPSVGLFHVERDSADNWVFVTQRPTREEVRITYLTDAPRDFFARALPDGPRVDARSRDIPVPLPPTVQRRALDFAEHDLGLTRQARFRDAVEALVKYFREFEESETPPSDTGDTYLDLARGKKGVCRHRAYAFTITALALGIPTRFVQNEAHAWVEIAIPDGDWMRVDLGGAANGLEAHNAHDAPLYRPSMPDTLPRPDPFARSYSQGHDVQGLRDPDPHATNGGLGAGGTGPNGTGNGPPLPSRPDHVQPSPSPGGGAIPPGGASTSRVPLGVVVNTVYREVFRGRELLVTGRVSNAATSEGVAGQRIEVSLQAPHGDRSLLLGVTVSRDGGDFRASFGVPPDVPVGDYRLTVIAPGDAGHAPGAAR